MVRRSAVTGQYKYCARLERIHQMLVSWASDYHRRCNSSRGAGYRMGSFDYSPCGKAGPNIPVGMEFADEGSRAIELFIQQTTNRYKEYITIKYIDGAKLSPYKHRDLLKTIEQWLYS